MSLTWNPDPFILVPLVALAWAYAIGTRALWRAAGHGRGLRTWQPVAFTCGVAGVVVALISPLDGLSDALFSAHMAQHLLLITFAAPLLALSSPQVALLWALSRRSRVALGHVLPRVHRLTLLASLPVAFVLHSAALWAWHAPPLYDAALRNIFVHALEHLVLLGTAFLFWSAAFNGLARSRPTLGASVLYVFALGAQCTGLGALIALSRNPWYTPYLSSSTAWGLSPLDDQVLAGALMWVPAGMVYLAFALLLLGCWLRPLQPSASSPAAPATTPPTRSTRMPPNQIN